MVVLSPPRIPLNAAEWLATRSKRIAWLFDAWPATDDDTLKVGTIATTPPFDTGGERASDQSQPLCARKGLVVFTKEKSPPVSAPS